MTEFIVNRLKGAETRDWMSSRPALKKAILTNDLSMPHLVDVVANIIGVWTLIVSCLNETGRKDDGDSLVVRSSSSGRVGAFSYPYLLCRVLFQKKGIDEYFNLDQMARMKFRRLYLLLEICRQSDILLSCVPLARSGSGKLIVFFPRNTQVLFHHSSMLACRWNYSS